MKQLTNTIEKLKGDAYAAVTVTDKDTLQKVVTNATGKMLEEKYGSVEGFFEWMNSQGINRLVISDRRSNGSGYKNMGEYHADLMQKEGVSQEPQKTASPTHAPARQAPAPDFFSGMGMAGLGGLNMVDVAYKTQDHARLTAENIQLKAKVEALEEANRKLEKENFRNEIIGTNTVEKAKANNELVQTLQPILAAVANKFLAPSVPAEAAGSLAGTQNLSPIRQSFQNIVLNADESLLQDLLAILNGMQNLEFDNELQELMKKYNLITD
jgi:hypothetical protein